LYSPALNLKLTARLPRWFWCHARIHSEISTVSRSLYELNIALPRSALVERLLSWGGQILKT